MRISELSRQTGVPVATIKFYLRERLLPPGTPTRRNQAEYGEQHVRRLWLIRTLTSMGQFELSAVRDILAAVESEERSLPDLYATVSRASVPAELAATEADRLDRARDEVDRLVDALGWRVGTDAAARTQLSHVVAALRRLGCISSVDFLLPYAETAERLTTWELDLVTEGGPDADRAAAVVRTILFEIALIALRRMAQEHHAAARSRAIAGRT